MMGLLKPMFAKILVVLFLLLSPNFAYDDKVTLSLYYESLCPYCANFIANDLGKIFETDLYKIVNLKLVPWGNTERENNTWTCQHGRTECALNIVEACAIHVWPKSDVHFKYIQCIEKLELASRSSEWKSCYQKLKLDPKPLSDCYTTKTGIDLILKAADETVRLNPPHQYVPWVLVNNKPLKEDYGNFIAHICKAYKGRHIPKACQSHVKISSFETKKDTTDTVCY